MIQPFSAPPASRQRPDPRNLAAWSSWAQSFLTTAAAPAPGEETHAWYIAAVMSGCEWRAAKDLHEDGIETYVPVDVSWAPRRTRRAGGKREYYRLSQPLLRGYVFARMAKRSIDDAIENETVIDLLRTEGGAPFRLSEEIIADLQARERRGEFNHTRNSKRTKNKKAIIPDWVEVGARVRLLEGAFATFQGVIESAAGSMIKVGVEIFGRVTPVEVEVGNIEPA